MLASPKSHPHTAPRLFPIVNTDAILPRLLELICDLYDDTEGFLDRTEDAQAWYNRGYADGVIHSLQYLGYARHVASALEPDPQEDPIAGHEALPWGKAYRHGWEMGRKETFEVMETD